MLSNEVVDLLADMAGDGGMVPIPADMATELLRVYRAWLDAPVGHVVGQSGPDGFFPQHSGAIVQMGDPASIKGNRVRLVRDAAIGGTDDA